MGELTFDADPSAPSQFYTGLVAELYDALVSYRPQADEYVPFLERSGTPALELACGSGRPLLDLVARGYDVEGLAGCLARHAGALSGPGGRTRVVTGFEKISFLAPAGGRAEPDATSFTALARRGGG